MLDLAAYPQLSLGAGHSLVLKQDGTVWAAGINIHGQLGIDSRTHVMAYTLKKVFADPANAVAAGGDHSMILKSDGSVWSTGRNLYGQLGDESHTDRDSFVLVIPSHAKGLAAGGNHSLVLMQDGSVRATGYNVYGQLGNGLASDSQIYVQVISNGAQAVAAGGFHSMVIKEDGSIWATGSNQDGQFGDGSITSEKVFTNLGGNGND